jgi:hypothetical protein
MSSRSHSVTADCVTTVRDVNMIPGSYYKQGTC